MRCWKLTFCFPKFITVFSSHESISVQDWLASNDPFYTSATQSSDPKDVRLRGVEALSKLPTLDKDFISQNVDHNASVTARSDSLPAYSDVSETKQDGAMNGGSARPPAYTGVLSLSGSQDGSTLSGNLKGRLPVGQPSRPPNLPSLASPFTFLPNSRQENREQLSRYPQSLEALPRLGQTEFHNVTRTDGVPQIPALQNQMLSGPLQRVQDNVPQIPTHTTRPVEDCRSVRLPKLAPL